MARVGHDPAAERWPRLWVGLQATSAGTIFESMKDTRYRSNIEAIQVSEDIIPLGEFRTHTARVLRNLHEQRRPVVITQNGRPAAVLLSPEEFDRLSERGRFVAAVSEGLADVEAGRVVDDEALDPRAPRPALRRKR
jgi:prevent-host-death family protein